MDREALNPVCLITPPSTFLLDERVFVSLGILRVAAVLERADYPVEHLDLCGIENYLDALRSHAKASPAAIFGITATTPQMPATKKIVTALREVRPDARIILGGPHATLVAAARKLEVKRGVESRAHRAFDALTSTFDVIVGGDGDEAIFSALKTTGNYIDADDPHGGLFLTNETYEELPFPARHLVDMNSYNYSIDGVRSHSMICQLGCSMKCFFCGGRNSPMLRRIRTRSNESVLAEIAELHDVYGVSGIQLYDDEVNLNKKQCVTLMNAIADMGEHRGIDFRLRGFIKSELFNEDQAIAMRRAGFRWILVGFESGSPRILENIQKNATLEENTRCLQIARANGLKVKALMSIGHAGESAETVEQTKQWLLDQRPDDFDCTVIACYPGAPYYDQAEQTGSDVYTFTAPKSGDRLHAFDVDYSVIEDAYKGKPQEYRAYVFTDSLSPDDLVRLRDDLESEVREKLGIPFNAGAPGIRYEASVGMLPGHMLRRSPSKQCA